MPVYISRPDDYELVLPGPYSMKGANARIYMMTADYGKMQATADRYLNAVAPAGTTYSPLGNVVVAGFMAIQEIRCDLPDLGFMHEVDCAFFIPLIKWRWGWPSDLAFFSPYLFVNNSWAMATGREAHGFRKDVAVSFSELDVNDLDEWEHRAGDLSHIDAWAMETRSASTRLAIHRLVELEAPAPPPSSSALVAAFPMLVQALLGDLGPLGRSLSSLPAPSGFASWTEVVVGRIIDKLTTTGPSGEAALRLPMVFLRQYRDPATPVQADVQSLVEADLVAPFSSMSGELLGGDFTLRFYAKASHEIAEELGLSAAESSRLTVDANLDFFLLNA